MYVQPKYINSEYVKQTLEKVSKLEL